MPDFVIRQNDKTRVWEVNEIVPTVGHWGNITNFEKVIATATDRAMAIRLVDKLKKGKAS